MVWHMQKRWRLKFRRDPDSGRVLFIGPLVVSLDVIARPIAESCMSRRAGAGSATGEGIKASARCDEA